MNDIRLDLVTDINSPSGYAAHARMLIDCLKDVVDIKVPPIKNNQVDVPLGAKLEEYMEMTKKTREANVILYFCTPEYWEPIPNRYNIGWLQWETTSITNQGFFYPRRQLHPEKCNWVSQMNRMDEVWTGCSEAKKAFERSGVKRPIRVFRGPINTSYWIPEAPEIEKGLLAVTHDVNGVAIPKDKRRFVVGFVGEWCKRKNVDALIATVCHALPSDRTVIVLKSYLNDVGTESSTLKKIVLDCKASLHLPALPPIVVIDEIMTDDEIRGLIQTFDLYYTASKGEGLDMPLLQAMSMEKIVACVNWGAHADYMKDQVNGFSIDYNLEIVRGHEI
jgi:glycosyltransferase involved in cell wall biosynthesis